MLTNGRFVENAACTGQTDNVTRPWILQNYTDYYMHMTFPVFLPPPPPPNFYTLIILSYCFQIAWEAGQNLHLIRFTYTITVT